MLKRFEVAPAVLAVVFVGAGAAASGGELSVSSRKQGPLMQYQLDMLDGRDATRFSVPVETGPERVRIPGAPEDPAGLGQMRAQPSAPATAHEGLARAAARENHVPEALFLRLVARESGWNARAVSEKGAIGLGQLLPETARRLGVNPHDPRQNLRGSARYLRAMFERFGTWPLALAAYNAGPEAVEKYNGIPPFDETRAYVAAILKSR